MTPNANDNPRMPCHHVQPKNEDDCPQTKAAAHTQQQMPTKTNDHPAHEWTWVATTPPH